MDWTCFTFLFSLLAVYGGVVLLMAFVLSFSSDAQEYEQLEALLAADREAVRKAAEERKPGFLYIR